MAYCSILGNRMGKRIRGLVDSRAVDRLEDNLNGYLHRTMMAKWRAQMQGVQDVKATCNCKSLIEEEASSWHEVPWKNLEEMFDVQFSRDVLEEVINRFKELHWSVDWEYRKYIKFKAPP